MAITGTGTTVNAALFRTVYDDEFGLDPTEESVVAGYVAQPLGGQAIGKEFVLRKLQAYSAQTWSGGSTVGLPGNLTAAPSNEAAVTASISYVYAVLEVDEPAMTRAINEGPYRTGLRKQLMAAINSKVDYDLLALNSGLSASESGTDIDDAMLRSALKQLSTNAKNKFKVGQTPVRLFISPTQIDTVLGISTIREYQIRGSAGSAPSGQMVNAYGISFAESGNITGPSYNNALILPDAFAIGYNIKPSFLPEQQDGIVTRFICRAEYAVCEWFDSSGVKLVTT